jgi:hypothetical protein
LAMATPKILAEKCEHVWRAEFTTGHLRGHLVSDKAATLVLSDHPYVEHTSTKIVVAESIRWVVNYAVKGRVRDTQSTTSKGLVINLRWD